MNALTLAKFFNVSARVALLPVALTFLAPATGVVSQAHAWWSCPSGYNVEFRNNPRAARCLKPGGQQRHADAGCPVGTTYNRDHRGTSDYCLPLGGTVVGRPFAAKCAPGQNKDIRAGGDRCYTNSPPTQRPVDRNVN